MKHKAVVGGRYTDSMHTLTQYLRRYSSAVLTESMKAVPGTVQDPLWQAAYLDSGHIDAPDIAEAVTDQGIPVAMFANNNVLHRGLRQCALKEDIRVVIVDTDSKVIVRKAAEVLHQSHAPLRATLISEDKSKKWQTEYGEVSIVLPHGAVLINGENTPQWVEVEDIDVVVGDREGNLIESGTVFNPTIQRFSADKGTPRTLALPVL